MCLDDNCFHYIDHTISNRSTQTQIYIVGTLETGNAMSEDTESETIRVNELGQGQEWLRGGLSVGSCAIG